MFKEEKLYIALQDYDYLKLKNNLEEKENEYTLLNHKLRDLCSNFESAISLFEETLFSRLLKTVLIVASDNFFLKKPQLVIHPNNKKILEKLLKQSKNNKWELICNKTIDPNSFKIHSEQSDIDATIYARWKEVYHNLSDIIIYGHVISINGLVLEVIGLKAPIGAECIIERIIDGKVLNISAEVMRFNKEKTLLFSFEETYVPLGTSLLGRVLNSKGHALDGLPELDSKCFSVIEKKHINPLSRKPINEILDTGICAINGLITIGRGQRIGIFSSSGIGKSILLGMMAKYTKADVVVIGLIGERGREVKDFIENVLGPDGLLKSVVIAAPADTSPLLQIEAASYATSIAEYFRDQDKNVLLIMDSLTRYAMAQREVALSLGELPVSRGYPSSVFSKIPILVERSGNTDKKGSITSFYTVLTENDEDQDPVSQICRSILDGHIVLSRYYADLGHYPAIDIESSISRVMPEIITKEQYLKACYFKKLVASYQRNKDLINIGAYVKGNDLVLDEAINKWKNLENAVEENNNIIKKYEETIKQNIDQWQ
ncbi:ATP synthase subunit beta, mitochondrial [Aphis craccivora]|uniref:Flagellum-specific ATP synthase n=1 Tax=Aphis craccivora TaxID=307492 RepID=A0A6G0XL34_APHCR|nr:ATP synthase subunit beta, mitochondrial [Aphis craccivora]